MSADLGWLGNEGFGVWFSTFFFLFFFSFFFSPVLTHLVVCGCLSRCCSLNCSVCYFVFSLWGFIMLLILGSLLSSNYEPIHLNELNATEASQAATGSYAAAGIYAGFMVLCAVRFAYIMFQRKKETQNQAYQRVN